MKRKQIVKKERLVEHKPTFDEYIDGATRNVCDALILDGFKGVRRAVVMIVYNLTGNKKPYRTKR